MISEEIHRIAQALPQGVSLVAVSKFHPAEAIREAYSAGQRIFGESHAQELQQKHLALSDLPNIQWHFIGHLQTNKVKYIAPYVDLIHAVDSPRLLAEIERQAARAGRTVRCLLQLHVATEETKFGFTPDEALAFLDEGSWQQMTHIRLVGVMAMATNTDDLHHRRSDFHRARRFFDTAQQRYFSPDSFNVLSMGMSDDWHIAIEEGATLIRIGTQIFGEREY